MIPGMGTADQINPWDSLLFISWYSSKLISCGIGNKGVSEQSPYDRILVTAAPAEIPRDLIDQLAINGIMVIPVGNQSEVQYLYRIKKLNDDEITKDKILPVYFVPLIKS